MYFEKRFIFHIIMTRILSNFAKKNNRLSICCMKYQHKLFPDLISTMRYVSYALIFMVIGTWFVRAKTNALLIAIDDLNDWVGCMDGHPQAFTPNIDRLAKRGMLFTNAHCQGPICGPSRASLLSGFYPHRTGIYQQPGGKGMEKEHEKEKEKEKEQRRRRRRRSRRKRRIIMRLRRKRRMIMIMRKRTRSRIRRRRRRRG